MPRRWPGSCWLITLVLTLLVFRSSVRCGSIYESEVRQEKPKKPRASAGFWEAPRATRASGAQGNVQGGALNGYHCRD